MTTAIEVIPPDLLLISLMQRHPEGTGQSEALPASRRQDGDHQ
jgi:hypothetical protein